MSAQLRPGAIRTVRYSYPDVGDVAVVREVTLSLTRLFCLNCGARSVWETREPGIPGAMYCVGCRFFFDLAALGDYRNTPNPLLDQLIVAVSRRKGIDKRGSMDDATIHSMMQSG